MSTINKQIFKFVLSRPSLLKFLLDTTNFEKYPTVQNARNYMIAKTIEGIYTAGETLSSVQQYVETLEKRNIGTILNYVKESASINELQQIESEHYKILDFLKLHPSSCVALKPTALIEPKKILNLATALSLSSHIYPNISLDGLISHSQVKEVSEPLLKLAEQAYKNNSRILIDAEQSSLQPAVDLISLYLMNIFNKGNNSVIYNTYQLYLKDSPIRIFHHQNWLKLNGSKFAAKIVRGAYLSYERTVQPDVHINYRLCLSKKDVDQNFDETANRLTLDGSGDLIIASHNIESIRKIAETLRNFPTSSKVAFAYLMGFDYKVKTAVNGFDCLEYVPYGPINAKIPYLLRRLEENLTTSILQ